MVVTINKLDKTMVDNKLFLNINMAVRASLAAPQ